MEPTPQTVDEMLRRQATQHASKSVLSCAGGGKAYGTYTIGELDRLATLTAHHYLSLIPEEYRQQRVVGIMGPTSIEYIATFFGLQRLGLTCLLLSPGLMPPGCIRLLDQAGCNVVLTQSVADDVMEDVRRKKDDHLVVIPMADSEYLFSTELPVSAALESLHIDLAVEARHPAWYVHSSGSTGMPKAIQHYSEGFLALVSNNPIFGYRDVIVAPVYHTGGLLALLGSLAAGSKTCFLDADAAYFRTARRVTAAGIMNALDVNDAQVLHGTPYALKIIAENPEGLTRLQQLKLVVTFGSPCPDALGDKLYALGVNLKNVYGSSELGLGLTNPDGGDWKWLQLTPGTAQSAHFEAQDEDADGILYHLILTTPNGPVHVPIPDRPDGTFGTKDLFRRHPTDPTKWKFVRRIDDNIVLATAGKADPTRFEEALRPNRFVEEVVVFGSGRPILGMLVIASEQARGMSRTQILAELHPAIEEENSKRIAVARVALDDIVIKEPGTWFPRADKGSVRRRAFLEEFSLEIEEFYQQLESRR